MTERENKSHEDRPATDVAEAQPEAKPTSGEPLWAVRLGELCSLLSKAPSGEQRDRVRNETWLLLNSALRKYIRIHAHRRGGLCREDQEDLAADRSLDLLSRIVSGVWSPAGRHPREIAGFVSTVARNCVINVMVRSVRTISLDDAARGRTEDGDLRRPAAASDDDPESLVAGGEFAATLRDCASRLAPTSRLVWILRTFFDLPSKSIARHPDVRVKTSHVDVIMLRARRALKECMNARGYSSDEIPPGSFARIWSAFPLELANHG